MIVTLKACYGDSELSSNGIRDWLAGYDLYTVFVSIGDGFNYTSEYDESLSLVIVYLEFMRNSDGSLEAIHTSFKFLDQHDDIALLFKLAFA